MNIRNITKQGLILSSLLFAFSSTANSSGSEGHHPSGHDNHSSSHKDKHTASIVGAPASPNKASQVFKVTLLDSMRFEFDRKVDIHSGDIVTFEITNKGKIVHEFSIGSTEEQKAHGKMMRAMQNMKHQDGNTVSLEPGATKTLTWAFSGEEMAVIACNIPGHFEAGMFHNIELTHAHK